MRSRSGSTPSKSYRTLRGLKGEKRRADVIGNAATVGSTLLSTIRLRAKRF
jgi:hypothetical protein